MDKSRSVSDARGCHQIGFAGALLVFFIYGCSAVWGQGPREKVIIDTDIGDDVDDAFALALAVKSPELQILGVTTTFGDTETRARIVDRFLGEVGRSDIPVLAGKPTSAKTSMSQGRYATGALVKTSHADAVEFILDQTRRNPGEITLIGIGPLENVGAAIDRDAATFKTSGDHGRVGPTRVRRLRVQRAFSAPARVEHSERRVVGTKALHGRRATLRDAAGFDSAEAGRGETRFPVYARYSSHRGAYNPLSHVGRSDADLI